MAPQVKEWIKKQEDRCGPISHDFGAKDGVKHRTILALGELETGLRA